MAATTLYEQSLVGRFAKLEATSLSWLAREAGGDLEEARRALERFGRKRPAEAELVHVVTGTRRVKSKFGDVECREIVLVPENEVAAKTQAYASFEASLYCVAPKDLAPSSLWAADAERCKALMDDEGDKGDAFRTNRGARVHLKDLVVVPLADWAPVSKPEQSVAAAKKKQKAAPPPPPVTKKEEKVAKKFAAFFTKNDKDESLEPKEPKRARRVVVDDDDDDVEPEQRPQQPNVPKSPQQPRMVEQTYVDEKGYLVTQKVMAPSPASEPPKPTSEPPKPPATKKYPNKAQPPKPKKTTKTLPKGQKDMHSFFKRT